MHRRQCPSLTLLKSLIALCSEKIVFFSLRDFVFLISRHRDPLHERTRCSFAPDAHSGFVLRGDAGARLRGCSVSPVVARYFLPLARVDRSWLWFCTIISSGVLRSASFCLTVAAALFIKVSSTASLFPRHVRSFILPFVGKQNCLVFFVCSPFAVVDVIPSVIICTMKQVPHIGGLCKR